MIATFSFDDGGRADRTVIPILQHHNVTGTFYLVSAYLNAAIYGGDIDFQSLYRGMEVGSHSCSHPHMSRLLEPEVRYEIDRSKERIEELTSLPVRLFAYPYGSVSEITDRVIQASGYRYARGIQRTHQSISRYRMPIDLMLTPSEQPILDKLVAEHKPVHVLCHSWAIIDQGLNNLLVIWIRKLKEAQYQIVTNSEYFDRILPIR